ncbi:histone methylation protein DOT1-domain-containing protein [Phlyctochytrium arcticum]|nr:histone methylation protein DOT1-domain-containing protein [Phlyctochytrium arcticum]
MEQRKVHKRIYHDEPRSPPKRHVYVPVFHPPSPSSEPNEPSWDEGCSTPEAKSRPVTRASSEELLDLPVSSSPMLSTDIAVSNTLSVSGRKHADDAMRESGIDCRESGLRRVASEHSRMMKPVSPAPSVASSCFEGSPEMKRKVADVETSMSISPEGPSETDENADKGDTPLSAGSIQLEHSATKVFAGEEPLIALSDRPQNSLVSSSTSSTVDNTAKPIIKRKRSQDASSETASIKPPSERKTAQAPEISSVAVATKTTIKSPAGTKAASTTPQSARKKSRRKNDHRHLSKRAMEPCISALTIVENHLQAYALPSQPTSKIRDPSEIETFEVQYPGEEASEIFPFVVARKALEYNPMKDIYSTTQMIVENCLRSEHRTVFGDTREGTLRSIQKACHKKNVEDLKAALEEWNEHMLTLKKKRTFATSEFTGPAASYHMVAHILEQAYSRSVAPSSSMLNNYEGFSNNVYGEVKHNFVNTLIKEAGIQPNHIFVDMGSGIGNVVLQVAAQVLCDSYGIEVMEIPAKLADKQKKEFLSRMRYYAKPCGRVTLKRADFLEDASMHEVIKQADIVFVNNYAFSAELNQMILAKFLDLKDGATMISLRSFAPVDRPTAHSARRANAIESIFRVKEKYFGRDCVSWMNEGGRYFVHTVDRRHRAKLYQ